MRLSARTAHQEAHTPSRRGYGWSALDLGRLLICLKIVGTDPRHADRTAAIVKRLKTDKLTRDGYMLGTTLESNGLLRSYQEGRLGYEEYSARGFQLWGRSTESSEQLLARLQDWCHRAEASGIAPLVAFSHQLRRYA